MIKTKLRFKEDKILCHRCVINVANALSRIPSVEKFSIDIDTKIIQVVYKGNKISKQIIRNIIYDSIVKGKLTTVMQ